MPTLPAFMSYRPQLKGKVKSPFSKRRFDSPSALSFSQQLPPSRSQEVLNIGEHARDGSMDFHDSPSMSFDNPRPPQAYRPPSPRLQLELDLTTDTEQLSDWFSTSFPRPESSKRPVVTEETRDEETDEETDSEMLREEEVFEDSIDNMSSGDVIANLEAMNASSFGRLRPDSLMPPAESKLKNASQRSFIPHNEEGTYALSRTMSMSELSSPPSSAVSGTTLARQLIGNGFSLSHDHRDRTSRLRPAVGLTRSDSMTLPQKEFEEHFEVGPDAPPIPHNADALYVAPKSRRDAGGHARVKGLKRRSSTGTMSALDPDFATLQISPSPRPSSVLVSPSDIHSAFPHSPLGVPPSPPPAISAEHHEKKDLPPAITIPPVQIRAAPDKGAYKAEDDLANRSPRNPEDEDVLLDYYSFSDDAEGEGAGTPPPVRGYRPIFTPITEESLSQLSPPAPYSKGDRRDSQRSQPLGARSPGTPSFGARSMLRSASESTPSLSMLSIMEEAKVPAQPQAMASTTNDSQTSINTLSHPLLPPPSLSKVFNRQRSGSAPSPIHVVRNAEDLSKYEITVSSRASEATNDVTEEQEFPETATAPWSAAFSPAVQHEELASRTEGPASATLPATNTILPNLQQVLLTRATTSVRVKQSHSRQVSLGVQKSSLPPIPNGAIEGVPEPRFKTETHREGDAKVVPPRRPPPQGSLPPSPSAGEQFSLQCSLQIPEPVPTGRNNIPVYPPPPISSIIRSQGSQTSVHSLDSASASTHTSQNSTKPPSKSLPIPPPPSSPPPSPPTHFVRGARARIPQPLELAQAAAPLDIFAEGSSLTPERSAQTDIRDPQQLNATESISRPPPESPPHRPQSSASRKSTNTIDEILRASTTLGTPPPYYSVVDQLHHQGRQASTFAPQRPDAAGYNPQTPSLTPSVTFSSPFASQQGKDSTISKSRLGRPAGPLGPRRPSLPSGPSQSANRDRIPSVASVTRQGSVGSTAGPSTLRFTPQRSELPLTSPKFQPPPIKHRGFTMEAAKWTFTSSQLQAVVSRAIRESAQTSSMRLLKLETLEEEIPEEIHRLEMYRTDIKSKYKALTKRRAQLLESLTFHLTTSGEEMSFSLRIVEELTSVASSLDHLAEELYSTDSQLAQLATVVQVHSSSALSMALRKLNASFLNQVSENKELQERIATVEAERDEAWKHAEDIANEYDHLNFQEKPDEPSNSNRSSRISAKRKSSIRVTKAGLRSQSSRRSSVVPSGFASLATSPLSSGPTVFRADKIPPLPPIPLKRRPVGIITDAPLASSGALSMDGMTPTSETRALVRAEQEVYSMLGLSVPTSGIRRSHSMIGNLPSAGLALSPPPLSAGISAYARRSSLPGEATLIEAQNAMLADKNAVVFTFEMLKDDEERSRRRYSRFT